jgi:formylglycine-generating enzyme required for sulfatase activity
MWRGLLPLAFVGCLHWSDDLDLQGDGGFDAAPNDAHDLADSWVEPDVGSQRDAMPMSDQGTPNAEPDGACTPSDEVCNLEDDDCDGQTDEVPEILEGPPILGLGPSITSMAWSPRFKRLLLVNQGAGGGFKLLDSEGRMVGGGASGAFSLSDAVWSEYGGVFAALRQDLTRDQRSFDVARIGLDGIVRGGTQIPISDTRTVDYRALLAVPFGYVVAHAPFSATSPSPLQVYFFSADGTPIGEPVSIGVTSVDPLLAWTGTKLAVVWAHETAGVDHEVRFARVSVTGEVEVERALTTNRPSALAWAGDQFGLLSFSTEFGLQLLFLDDLGRPLGIRSIGGLDVGQLRWQGDRFVAAVPNAQRAEVEIHLISPKGASVTQTVSVPGLRNSIVLGQLGDLPAVAWSDLSDGYLIHGPFGRCSADCSPTNEGEELPDGIDQDCDGRLDEGPPGFALVAPGRFLMGAADGEVGALPDELPRHPVVITSPFLLQRTETTRATWSALTGEAIAPGLEEDLPVVSVGLEKAAFQANRWSIQEGFGPCYDCPALPCPGLRFHGPQCNGYRLPTEAEWEYAARAGTQTSFWTGDALSEAWFSDNAEGTRHPVARWAPSPLGLFDVHGNVAEQTWGSVAELYRPSIQIDPVWNGEGEPVARGGAYNHGASTCRSARRLSASGGPALAVIGLRFARTLPATCRPHLAGESCNSADDDCDGAVDEGGVCPCPVTILEGRAWMECPATAWAEARALCLSADYDLAVLDGTDPAAARALAALVGDGPPAWVGLTFRAGEGFWRGTNGVLPSDFAWAPGEGAGGGCAAAARDPEGAGLLWSDLSCDDPQRVLCAGSVRSLNRSGATTPGP